MVPEKWAPSILILVKTQIHYFFIIIKGQRRCDKHWQCANPSQSLANCNDKIWVEDQTSCKTLLATECSDVTNYRTVKQPYEKCEQESYDDCQKVPSQVCETVTREECLIIDCQEVPYQQCEQVHKIVPEQVQQQKEVTICDGNGVNARTTEAEASVINPRQDDEINFEINPRQNPNDVLA